MLKDPSRKYRPAPTVPMAERRWPGRTLRQAPAWCSVDLRDGNQALANPMTPTQKWRYYQMLVKLGFRHIEVGYPAASRDDFAFVRQLIEQRAIPPQVTPQVLSSARPEHLARTFEALRGAPRAVVHFYLSTSPVQRRWVFGLEPDQLMQLAVRGAQELQALAARQPETDWTFQFSPESFSATEPEFALAVCEAVLAVWQPTPEHKAILNLPATVEVAAPNHFADQVEWLGTHLSQRQAVILSVHPHNDRGGGAAAAELALLAGAERVEGALFGLGERAGNLDLVTLALNLYTQGIDPGLDFSNLDEMAACFQECTGQAVPPRHPYAGELVYNAYSGTHQDAIRKGLQRFDGEGVWEVPYLPIDPADLGRSRAGVIRVNSQSGKAGAAFLLARETGVALPAALERPFAQAVQRQADATARELTASEIAALFHQELLAPDPVLELAGYDLHPDGCGLTLTVRVVGQPRRLRGRGNGPIDAALQALAGPWQLRQYEERAVESGSQARAAAFVALAPAADCQPVWGAGLHANIVTASLQAVTAAAGRLLAGLDPAARTQCLSRWQQEERP